MANPSLLSPGTPGQPRPFLLLGFDGLTYRLAQQLSSRHGGDVIVLMTREQRRMARDFAGLATVRVLVRDRIDETAMREAGLPTVAGVALTVQDDAGNIHLALQIRELAPGCGW